MIEASKQGRKETTVTQIITISDLKKLIQKIGIHDFINALIDELKESFNRWHDFKKSPRHATHFKEGVIELMPICNDEYYSFKYVNGHPNNPAQQKFNVVAIGLLAQVSDGYPILISEMTLLTAIRTAATSALAAQYLARKNSKTLAIIGTGAQSEFQTLGMQASMKIDTVRYFDIDSAAMNKFNRNLQNYSLNLVPCQDVQSCIEGADIITTATAAKQKGTILKNEWILPGVHINGIGGDCPGKTELDPKILNRSKIVVEFLEQTQVEGEIQNIINNNTELWAELWELTSNKKTGRENEQEITLFDSVGFALEDFATLKLIYKLAKQYQIGHKLDLLPDSGDSGQDPKDLFKLLL